MPSKSSVIYQEEVHERNAQDSHDYTTLTVPELRLVLKERLQCHGEDEIGVSKMKRKDLIAKLNIFTSSPNHEHEHESQSQSEHASTSLSSPSHQQPSSPSSPSHPITPKNILKPNTIPFLYIDSSTILTKITDIRTLRRGDHVLVALNPFRKVSVWFDSFVMWLGYCEVLGVYHHFIVYDDVHFVDDKGTAWTKNGDNVSICEYSSTPYNAFLQAYHAGGRTVFGFFTIGLCDLWRNPAPFQKIGLNDYITTYGVFKVVNDVGEMSEGERDEVLRNCRRLMEVYEGYSVWYGNCEHAAFALNSLKSRWISPQIPYFLWNLFRFNMNLLGVCFLYCISNLFADAASHESNANPNTTYSTNTNNINVNINSDTYNAYDCTNANGSENNGVAGLGIGTSSGMRLGIDKSQQTYFNVLCVLYHLVTTVPVALQSVIQLCTTLISITKKKERKILTKNMYYHLLYKEFMRALIGGGVACLSIGLQPQMIITYPHHKYTSHISAFLVLFSYSFCNGLYSLMCFTVVQSMILVTGGVSVPIFKSRLVETLKLKEKEERMKGGGGGEMEVEESFVIVDGDSEEEKEEVKESVVRRTTRRVSSTSASKHVTVNKRELRGRSKNKATVAVVAVESKSGRSKSRTDR